MRPHLLSLLALTASLLFASTEPRSLADDPAPGPERLVLFDGRSLDGWQPMLGERSGKVTVEGESLALAVGNPMTGVTSSHPHLPTTDYVLTYEAKRTAGNDFFAAATFPVGNTFVTLVTGGWGGSVTGLSLIDGASAAENTTNHFVKYTNDVWYAFKVQVTAKAIRCLVDDREVFVFAHEDAQLKTRIEQRANQPLGFTSYRSAGLIRKVEVKALTALEIKEIDARIGTD